MDPSKNSASYHESLTDIAVLLSLLLATVYVASIYILKSKAKTVRDFLHGRQPFSSPIIALSLTSVLIDPHQLLQPPSPELPYGLYISLQIVSIILSSAICIYIFVPVFLKTLHNNTSIFTYLSRRYNSTNLSKACALISICQGWFFTASLLYSCTSVLSQYSAIPLPLMVFLNIFACTFYTSMGGMNSIVSASLLQLVLTIAGLGVSVFYIIEHYSNMRISANEIFIQDLYQKLLLSTFGGITTFSATLLITSFINHFITLSSRQDIIQKYCTLKSATSARSSLSAAILLLLIFILIINTIGIMLHSLFSQCHSGQSMHVISHDQLLTLLINNTPFKTIGLSGLFAAGVYGCMLSTISSIHLGMCSNIYEDFLEARLSTKLSHGTKLKVIRGIVFSIGVATLALSLTQIYSANLRQISVQLTNILSGSLAAIFLMSIVNPFSTRKAMFISLFFSIAMASILCVLSVFTDMLHPGHRDQSTSTEFNTSSCVISTVYRILPRNFTDITPIKSISLSSEVRSLPTVNFIVTALVGFAVSVCLHNIKTDHCEADYICLPLQSWYSRYLQKDDITITQLDMDEFHRHESGRSHESMEQTLT